PFRHERHRDDAARAGGGCRARTVAPEPRLDRERRHAERRRGTERHTIVEPVETNRRPARSTQQPQRSVKKVNENERKEPNRSGLPGSTMANARNSQGSPLKVWNSRPSNSLCKWCIRSMTTA